MCPIETTSIRFAFTVWQRELSFKVVQIVIPSKGVTSFPSIDPNLIPESKLCPEHVWFETVDVRSYSAHDRCSSRVES